MNSKLDLLLNNRSYYKICYFIFLSLNMLQYINITVVSRIMLAFFMLWGIYIILLEVIVKMCRNYFGIEMKLLICMLLLCMMSYIYNWENQGAYNIFALLFFTLCILIMYANDYKVNTAQQEMIAIAKCYSVISIITSAICIYMFLAQISITILGRSGSIMRIGIWENRLFGVFSSPNVGGTFFSIGIYLSFFLFYISAYKKKHMKIWRRICFLNIFMSSWYLVLSLSRGTYVSFFLSLTVGFVLFKIPQFQRQDLRNRILKKTIILIFMFAVIGFYSKGMRLFSQIVVNSRIEKEISFERIEYSNIQNTDSTVETQPEALEKKSIDPSNKRFSIWQSSLKLALKTPLTGVGNSFQKLQNMDVSESAFLTEYEQVMINYSGGNIHNGYLQLFVCCGGLAVAVFLVFLFYALFKVIIRFPRISKINTRNSCVFSFAIVVYILVNNLFETNMVLMGANSFQAAMWMFSGYVILFCSTKRKEEVSL